MLQCGKAEARGLGPAEHVLEVEAALPRWWNFCLHLEPPADSRNYMILFGDGQRPPGGDRVPLGET